MTFPNSVRFSEDQPFLDHECSTDHPRKTTKWDRSTALSLLAFSLLAVLLIGSLALMKHVRAGASTHQHQGVVSNATAVMTKLPRMHIDRSYHTTTSTPPSITLQSTTTSCAAATATPFLVNISCPLSLHEDNANKKKRKSDSSSSSAHSTSISHPLLLKFAVFIITALLCGSYSLPLVVLGALSGVLADPLAAPWVEQLPEPFESVNTTYSDGITRITGSSTDVATTLSNVIFELTATAASISPFGSKSEVTSAIPTSIVPSASTITVMTVTSQSVLTSSSMTSSPTASPLVVTDNQVLPILDF